MPAHKHFALFLPDPQRVGYSGWKGWIVGSAINQVFNTRLVQRVQGPTTALRAGQLGTEPQYQVPTHKGSPLSLPFYG